jgi:regulator of sirC expression with transglutaminase-like and TPR domain
MSTARERFRALVRKPEASLPLVEAALCIAWEDQVDALAITAMQTLQALVDDVRGRLADLPDGQAIVAALNHYLFEELGFRGNQDDYHNPANSYLDQVLERRTGLPITLAVIYIEFGRLLGLPIHGVALPGHFIVRYAAPEGDLFIDPFHGGRLWSYGECVQQIEAVYNEAPPELIETFLAPPTKRAILGRMLRNLKHSYLQRGEFSLALAAVERIILLDHSDPEDIRDRGLLRLRLGQTHAALEDLDRYARLAPNAADMFQLGELAASLARGVIRQN